MTKKPSRELHLTNQFSQAVDYARHLHIERRKGTGIPYMAHLLGVAALVMGEAGHAPVSVTEEMVITALLHDAVEDYGGLLRLEDIQQNFGADVARMVEGLTDSFAGDAGDKEPWLERKKGYIQRLRTEPLDVQLISVADKLYNARAILDDYREVGADIWQRFQRGRNDQLWYFKELVKIFRKSDLGRIVGELERVVEELTQLSAAEDTGQSAATAS
jgi:(p)ppGpp synthase/HD superfamily hydrolase